jgi:hypothetical protein
LDEGEPTYDGMEADTAEGLAGYAKLKNFCIKARENLSGQTPAVSTKTAILSSTNRFVPCFDGITIQPFISCTWHKVGPLWM